MEQTYTVSCSMDCPDLCRFQARVKGNEIRSLIPDKAHPVTRGFACKKAKFLVDRMGHPDRIRHPMIRTGMGFEPVGYDAVLEILCDRITRIKEKYGTRAILNYTCDGYGGLKGRIQSIFFNCLGGVTQPRGSLCWGAGIAAQTYDFGNPKGHFPSDVLNADLVLVWGRNPKYTNIHLYALLKQARAKGSKIRVIDPVQTATAKAFGGCLRVRPATDGALALAMAHAIIARDLHDKAFIRDHVKGFNRFSDYVRAFTPERAETITGIDARVIEEIAIDYARTERAAIYIGFGLQRYRNGGNTVRCIDALGAITGKIGKKGCGVNYAARSLSPYLYSLEKQSRVHARNRREFTIGRLGEFLEAVQDPPVQAAFVANGNPLTQCPDLETTRAAFSRIPFKVVFDHFMTDTAQMADLVLPAAFVYEQEDIFATSMYSHVVNYSQQAVDPPEGVVPEFDFYLMLARGLGLKNLGFKDSRDYLTQSAQPMLDKTGMDFKTLHQAYPRIPADEIAWEDKVFETPSGKFELVSEKAIRDGLSGLPAYIEPKAAPKEFPLRLLTCHTSESMHSQSFAFVDAMPEVRVNRATADRFDLENGQTVAVKGKKGRIRARLAVDEAIGDDTAFIYQGSWRKSGAVNQLTESLISDMGRQAAYYDSFCALVPVS